MLGFPFLGTAPHPSPPGFMRGRCWWCWQTGFDTLLSRYDDYERWYAWWFVWATRKIQFISAILAFHQESYDLWWTHSTFGLIIVRDEIIPLSIQFLYDWCVVRRVACPFYWPQNPPPIPDIDGLLRLWDESIADWWRICRFADRLISRF